jgi:hypothetical protein
MSDRIRVAIPRVKIFPSKAIRGIIHSGAEPLDHRLGDGGHDGKISAGVSIEIGIRIIADLPTTHHPFGAVLNANDLLSITVKDVEKLCHDGTN